MLRKFLQTNYDVVDKPDHPYIINGPDFLIDDGNDLSALFIQSGSNNFELIYRVIATRLVYPFDTKMVLVHTSDDPIFVRHAEFCDNIIVKDKAGSFNIIQSPFSNRSDNRYKKLKKSQRILFSSQMEFFDKNMEYLEKNNQKIQELIPNVNQDDRFLKTPFYNQIENKTYETDELYTYTHHEVVWAK